MHYISFKIFFFVTFFQTILFLISASMENCAFYVYIHHDPKSKLLKSKFQSFTLNFNGPLYLQIFAKLFTNWFVSWYLMIDKRELFVFWIRESQTNNTPTSTTKYPGLLWQREHDSREAFDHYRVKVFFESLDLATNE